MKHTMDVLVPNGFAIDYIEKCMMDYDCNFIDYDNEEAINSRLGSRFIVLKETHFIAHYQKQQVKCDYNCRNRIMKELISDDPWIGESQYLEKTDDVIRSKNPPYLLFTNECVRGSSAEDGSIISNYTTVDIPSFAKITKSKQCNDKFFMVNLGNDEHLCCNIQTLETYKYHSSARLCVLNILIGKLGEPFNQLQSEYDILKMLTPPPRYPNFKLLDIEGNPVEENTDYQLELYDQDMDILNFCNGTLSATACDNQVETLVINHSIVDGIHYLTYNNKYLYVADGSNEINLADQLPSKQQRLQFGVTEDNTLIIFKWNRFVFLKFETFTNSYSALSFDDEAEYLNTGQMVQLYLKRV
jgi:hypothetical protein